ncbi:hypothetical protein B4U78_015640 [Microbacterium esteraromaticum]|nr:hypothetical protein B4U78_015640 [Microbacterium esteraromaticum]
MPQFASKNELIDHVIFLFSREGGEKYLHTSGKDFQKNSTEVFWLDDFQKFLKKKYPSLNSSDIQEILKQIKSEDKYFHDFNRCFFQKLRSGHAFRGDGEINSNSIQLIDFENVHNNIFKIVDRQTFSASRCEVDLIIYINGIPLVVWAFKDPKEKLQGTETLINGDLSSRLPELLKYNAFCVICNGINRVRYGIS